MENKNTSAQKEPMEFTFTPEPTRVKCRFFEKPITYELSSDYTLPDYLPEIRKILGIRHKISPISRYIGNSVEFSGRVDYDLIYCSDGGELTSVPLGEDFSIDVTPEIPSHIDWASGGEAFASFAAEAVNARATAPRKINVKCRLSGNSVFYGYDEPQRMVSGIKNAEKLQSDTEYTSHHQSMSEVIELSDEISIGGETEQYRYIETEGKALINDTNRSGNMLNCRGEIIYDTVAENKENGELRHFSGKIPFTHSIELPAEIDENSVHSVICHCNEIKVSDGGNKYLLDAELLLEVDSLKNSKVLITEDLFVPGYDSEITYRDFKYEILSKSGCEKLTLNETIALKEASENGTENEKVDCITALRLDPIKQSGENATICGSMKAKLIYRSNGEYYSQEISLPFSADIGSLPQEEKRNVKVYPCICNVLCRINGKEAIIEADIALSYAVMQKEKRKIVDNIKIGDVSKKHQTGITVYYPEKDESLWNVAKKFGISMDSLAAQNGLNSPSAKEPISGKHFLMIS